MSSTAHADWCSYMREVCGIVLRRGEQRQIGGVGFTVEIDETVLARRKYNRGRCVREQWLVGGICREDKGVFLQLVEDRTAATLLDVIQRYVARGTTVYTDEFRSYRCLSRYGYDHHTVNHSANFVDPATGYVPFYC